MKPNRPIGIFDSGIGGLTVARAVKKRLPNERLVYFGDTAHLPYGDKSTVAIQAYSVRISEMLLQRKCKVILIACNSASSAAYDLVAAYVGQRAEVFDVINPTIDFIRENHTGRKIGLIGTKQTVLSGVYAKKIHALNAQIDFYALATPLLVPMIEEGLSNNPISQDIIFNYLSNESLEDIQALILGCTHYPMIKKEIKQFYLNGSNQVKIIDAAEKVAKSLKAFLEFNRLASKERIGEDEFLVSDYTPSFEKTTRIFFGEEVGLEKVAIWDEMN